MKPFLFGSIATIMFSPSALLADSDFRKQTSESHYYNNECCYCAVVEFGSMKRLNNGMLQISVLGQTFTVPNSNWRGPSPEKPQLNGVIVCDPVEQDFFCLIAELGA